MSDTTITPEERALWASTAAARINAVTPERQCEITAQERLVKALKAIEQTEARAEKAEARVKSRNNHIHRLLGEALENERNLDGMKSRWQTAEAGNARLTKMAQILSEWCAQFESGHTLGEIGLALSNGMACPEPWQYLEEAARRAVAAGEG